MNSIIIHGTLKEENVEDDAMVSEILCHFHCGSLKVLSKKALDSAFLPSGISAEVLFTINPSKPMKHVS